MQLKMSLAEDYSAIYKKVLDSLIPDINKMLIRAISKIQPQIKEIIESSLSATPEVQSLMGGNLQSELGVPDAESRIKKIISVFAASLKIDYIPMAKRGNLLYGGFILTAIKGDYSDVLSLPEAAYDTEKGKTIRWLEWLVFLGDNTIIREYTINTDVFNKSRTGLGQIMMKSKKGSWRVPPEFSGTDDNNFVTRGISKLDPILENLIKQEMK